MTFQIWQDCNLETSNPNLDNRQSNWEDWKSDRKTWLEFSASSFNETSLIFLGLENAGKTFFNLNFLNMDVRDKNVSTQTNFYFPVVPSHF